MAHKVGRFISELFARGGSNVTSKKGMMGVKANFFSINGVCPLDQRRKVGEEEREMKGD
jgi:hypothetical protein